MAKVTATLWKSKQTADGDYPIYLTIRHQNKRAVIATEHTVAKTHWNPKAGEVRKSRKDYRVINDDLQGRIADINSIITEMIAAGLQPEPAEVKRRYESDGEVEEETAGFLAYFDELLAGYHARGQIGTWKAYRTQRDKLAEFLLTRKMKDIPLGALTAPLLREYISWLYMEKGNKTNTVHKSYGTLRTVFRRAQDDGLVSYALQPFKAVKIKKEPAVKEKLSTDEVRRLATVKIRQGTVTACVRDMWLFAFYAGGMRFKDVALAKRSHIQKDGEGNWRSLYRMGKTRDIHSVLLVDEAMVILRRYGFDEKKPADRLFPLMDGYDLSTPEKELNAVGRRNAYANKALQRLAKRAGIETHLTFHLSRHSIAGYLLEQGYDVRTIQKVIGHATVTQTEHYLAGFTSSGPDEAMRGLKL